MKRSEKWAQKIGVLLDPGNGLSPLSEVRLGSEMI
jgi:hypothetical protein